MAQACTRGFESSLEGWRRVAARAGDDDALSALVRSYLSTAHRDRPGDGCVVAALGAEAARHGPALRAAITDGTRSLVDLLSGLVPGRSKAAKREKALAAFAAMVGALVLVRAVDEPALLREILQAVAGSVSSRSG